MQKPCSQCRKRGVIIKAVTPKTSRVQRDMSINLVIIKASSCRGRMEAIKITNGVWSNAPLLLPRWPLWLGLDTAFWWPICSESITVSSETVLLVGLVLRKCCNKKRLNIYFGHFVFWKKKKIHHIEMKKNSCPRESSKMVWRNSPVIQ